MVLRWFSVFTQSQHTICAHRTDPRFQVGGVPTLVHWTAAGAAGSKLGGDLEDAKSPEEAVALVAKFILDTKDA